MVKRIENVYVYKDYRLILSEDYLFRSLSNPKYSIRSHAKNLRISAGFLSEVLKAKKELSPDKGRKVFSLLGFDDSELEYIENLIIYRSSKEDLSKEKALKYIQSKFIKSNLQSKSEKSLILKSDEYFIVHGLVGCTPEHEKLIKAGTKLGISPEHTEMILKDFVENGYLKFADQKYELMNINLNIPNHTDILSTQQQFIIRILSLIDNLGGINPPQSISNYYAFGLDHNTLPLAAEAYSHLKNTLVRLSNQTPQAEMYAFFSSTFLTLDVVE